MKFNIHSDFLNKVISVFSTKVLLFAVGIIASVLSARLLGPEGRGVFGVAIAVCGIGVQFGNLGMHSANTFYLAKDKGRLHITIGNSLALSGIIGIISILVYSFFSIFPQFAPVNGITLFLGLIFIPFQLYLMFQQNFFIALGKISKYNKLEIMSGAFYPILLVILALFGSVTPQSALAVSIIGCALVIIIGFIWIKAMTDNKISLDIRYFKQTLPFGIKTYIACLFSYLVLRADILMLNYFLGKAETGLYSIAVSLADMVNMLSVTVGMLLFPAAVNISSDFERHKFIKKVITFMFFAMLILILVAIVISKFAILLLYGPEYAPSIKVFNILMPGILCLSISSLLSNYFASKNMLTINMITPMVAFVINALVNLILIPRYGINGSALASTVTYISMFCIMFITFVIDGKNGRLKGGKLMRKANLNIYYSNSVSKKNNSNILQFEELVRIAKSREFLKFIWKYKSVTFYCPSFTAFPRPFLTAVICRLMTIGKCKWKDNDGNTLKIGIITLMRLFSIFLYENFTYKYMLEDIEKEIDILLQTEKSKGNIDFNEKPVYLRCDLAYGYVAGGSIGHIAGVLNNLSNLFKQNPLFITTDVIPTVKEDIEFKLIKEKISYGNVRDISGIAFNRPCYNVLEKNIKKASILYQRSALNGYAGIKFAMKKDIPFVLEYNGSEVWAAENWGGRVLKGYQISKKIEKLTFEKADLIVCVSSPLKDQLVELGIDENKILINPNGVNPQMYSPEIDGAATRERYGIPNNKTVVGFIGTFGAWHGADILAAAFVQALKINQHLHMLLIGDGIKMPEVKSIIKSAEIEKNCTFTGIVPQKDGAEHLACCDILVSPQVRNSDGTPFFGSPTKLFEYMAMGKAIITSNMDQMAEIFKNGENAILCEPGDVDELADAICKLAEDKELRLILGKNARIEVCSKYTWQKHTEKTISKLKEILN